MIAPDQVAGVVLAAGLSTRMGGNKLLLELGGEPVVARAVRTTSDAGLDPVLVVVGHDADRVRAAIADLPVATVANPDPARGIHSSLRVGFEALGDRPDQPGAAVVLLGDMPLVSSAMVRGLVERWRASQFHSSLQGHVPRRSPAEGEALAHRRSSRRARARAVRPRRLTSTGARSYLRRRSARRMPVPPLPHRSGLASRSSPRDGRAVAVLAAAIAAGGAVLVYRDVLRGYFWSDDFVWLFLLHERGLFEFLVTPMGGHTLLARNALIALLDGVAGLDPRPWFATVLLTHAVNVVLLARLVWLLTGSAVLAGVGALAWGICPAAGETLGWYAVYAQVAATTCLLAAFGRMASRVRQGGMLSRRDLVVVTIWLALSSLFFGTALAVALVWPLAAALLFPGSLAEPRRLAGALAVPVVVLVLYATLQLLGTRTYETQALPLQLLVWLGQRWWAAVVSLAQLLRVGVASLLLGAWWAPGPRSDLFSWLVLAIAVLAWAVAAWRAPSRQRATLLAFAALAVAIYGLIAVGRGPLAGPLFRKTSAQVGATPRYHYAPHAVLAVTWCAVLSTLAPGRLARGRDVLAVAWGFLLLAGLARNGVHVDRHDASRAEVGRALDTLRAAIAAAPPGETVYVENAPLSAFGWLPNTMDQPPGLAGLFIIAFPTDTVDGRVVRFVEPQASEHDLAQRRAGRSARLLVEAPGS